METKEISIEVTLLPEHINGMQYFDALYSVDQVNDSERLYAEGHSEAEAIANFIRKATQHYNKAILLNVVK